MKDRISLIAFLFVAAVLCAFYPLVGEAQTPSTTSSEYPLPVLDAMMTTGFVAPATPTVTCTNYAKKIPALPSGTKAFYIVASGALNYGGSSVSNSSTGAFMTIADKGIAGPFKVSPLKLSPEVYVVNNATGASPVARIVAVK